MVFSVVIWVCPTGNFPNLKQTMIRKISAVLNALKWILRVTLCTVLFVGLQPTVNASRAPHLLPEQSVLLKESWTCVARQQSYQNKKKQSRCRTERGLSKGSSCRLDLCPPSLLLFKTLFSVGFSLLYQIRGRRHRYAAAADKFYTPPPPINFDRRADCQIFA